MPFCYIGSIALKDALPQLDIKTNDVDAITSFDEAVRYLKTKSCKGVRPMNRGKTLVGADSRGRMHEMSIAWPDSTNAEFLEIVGDRNVANLDELFALKMSHRYLRNSPHFLKTRSDILLMRKHGAKIPDNLQDWFKRREKETYNYGHPSLAQNKQNFFSGDGVQYTYDHDSIHEAVAILDEPIYRKYVKEGAQVQCDKTKWDALPEQEKRWAVAEETAVLAIERSLVPFPGVLTQYRAFGLALEKVCTSITSGWFREFAWENYDNIIAFLDVYPYWDKFQEGLKKGVVKPYVV